MQFSFDINLSLFDKESKQDLWDLSELFCDSSLSDFIEDNMYAKYIYFIKENQNIIGFVYLMKYKNADIYNLEYGLKESKLNYDYIYTVLTLIRDKIKGLKNSNEIKDITIVSTVIKNDKYNSIASKFGKLIYSDKLFNYYEVNPNCEELEQNNNKVLKFLKNNRKK